MLYYNYVRLYYILLYYILYYIYIYIYLDIHSLDASLRAPCFASKVILSRLMRFISTHAYRTNQHASTRASPNAEACDWGSPYLML